MNALIDTRRDRTWPPPPPGSLPLHQGRRFMASPSVWKVRNGNRERPPTRLAAGSALLGAALVAFSARLASAEVDVGYAQYTFDSPTYKPERFYDVRGRFVMGPTLTHEFSGHYFIRARGEAVAWLRDVVGQYQVNVDDVWAQVGDKGRWDLKVGRFFSWRVYHKGLGVDLYTLDDTGARSENDVDNPQGF